MTTSEARDELFAMVKAAWDTGATVAINVDKVPTLIWQGLEPSNLPPVDEAYGRVTVLHNQRQQATLAGAEGTRRYDNSGVLMVQCFGPLSSGRGLTIAEALATLVKNTFEGRVSPSGAWFRRCRVNEAGPSDGWYQVNAVVEFSYDEVR